MTIPITLFMGFYMRVLRPGRVIETTAIGVALLLLAIVAGGWSRRRTAPWLTSSRCRRMLLAPRVPGRDGPARGDQPAVPAVRHR
jgi:carbon starvation protein CstA